jgi:hypothetical protein
VRNPFLDRVAKRNIGDSGRKSEKRTLKSMGAKPQPASGAMAGAKSDGILKKGQNFRLELKSTTAQTLKLEREWLEKISQEALGHRQVPALVLSFVDEEGKPAMKRNAEWVAIPKHIFEELTNE